MSLAHRLALAILPVMLVSVLGGLVTNQAIPVWYETLAKPSFNPPNWVFGPVWTLLYALMAWAVFRILAVPPSPQRRHALILFFLQLVLNGLWSPAFFGLRSPLLGLVVIVPMLVAIVATIRAFSRLDRLSAGLLVPYALWVSYACVLNAAIWRLNG